MARGNRVLLFLGFLVGGGLIFAVSRAQAAPEELQPSAPIPPSGTPAGPGNDDTSDETALARMLASETRKYGGRVVIGWITVQRARRAGRSLYTFLTRGKGWGPIEVNGKATGRHASTAEQATKETRELARQLLSGEIQASEVIRRHRPGSWVERKQTLTDEDLIAKQAAFREGIYARVAGTNWVLYSADTPQISVAPFKDATARLDALPVVPAQDKGIA